MSVHLVAEGARALLFFSILTELDLAVAMQALLVPTEKLTQTGFEHARERTTALADQLGAPPAEARLGLRFAPRPADRVAARPLLLPATWDSTATPGGVAAPASRPGTRLRMRPFGSDWTSRPMTVSSNCALPPTAIWRVGRSRPWRMPRQAGLTAPRRISPDSRPAIRCA